MARKDKTVVLIETIREKLRKEAIDEVLRVIRSEYTVLPRFAYHQPLDYSLETFPAEFDPVELRDGLLPIPGPRDRMGYSPDNTDEYLKTGKYDHDLILEIVDEHYGADATRGFRILDFGCSTGRVLRNFDAEHSTREWKLAGVDIQARTIQWLRQHFPPHFEVCTSSLLPHLPYQDNNFDVIYGISVFTHIKYLWDQWILELRRVTKPGGLIIQTFHSEEAWRFYHDNQDLEWVKKNQSEQMLKKREMEVPYFCFGDVSVSQVFWKVEIAREYWSRYLKVLDVKKPPPKFSFQNWIVCEK